MKSSNLKLSEITKEYENFSKIFEIPIKDKKALLTKLKKMEIPNNQVCAKVFNKQGAVFCEECSQFNNSLICMECYEHSKELHKNHTLSFKNVISGCCDCGNPEFWKPSGFCNLHSGIFSNDKEINDFIKSNFSDDIINKINIWIDNIINMLTPYFLLCEKEMNIINNQVLNDIMKSFTGFLNEIFESNSALIHLFSFKFLKNYPYMTIHDCILNKNDENLEIVYSQQKEHICQCSFFKILLSVWTDKIECENLLYLFLQNYRIKIELGLNYIAIYNILIHNNAKNLFSFACQVFTSDFMINVIKNPVFIVNMFSTAYEELVIILSLKDKKWNEYLEKIKRLDFDINYLIKPTTVKLISSHTDIYKNLINLMALFHNTNCFIVSSAFVREGYSQDLMEIEYYILDLFSIITCCLDFEDLNQAKDLFFYIGSKFSIQRYQVLKNNSFSFHIVLIRAFSMLLNRFCFCYSINNKCTMFDALKIAVEFIPNHKKVFAILIQETMKFFGFILSIECNFWVYYGENMKKYVWNYFDYFIFHQCDFNLIKLMMCLEENKEWFSINKILELCNVSNSHIDLINKVFNNIEKGNSIYYNSINQEKNNNLNKRIFEFFIKIIRDNSSPFDLFEYSLGDLKRMRINDDLTTNLIKTESEQIKNIIKEKIIDMLISHNNLYTYSAFIQYIHLPVFEEKEIQNIFEEMTDKIVQNNEQFKFSLKNIYLKNIDLDYILSSNSTSNSERYINDFKKKEVCILNYNFYEPFTIQKTINFNCYYYFYYFHDNFKFLLNFSIQLVSNKNYQSFIKLFLISVFKLILIFLYVDKNLTNEDIKKDKDDFYKYINEKLNILFDYFKDETITNDTDRKIFYKFMAKNIAKYLNIEYTDKEEEEEKIREQQKKNLQLKKKKLMEKYKKKFNDKNLQILKSNKKNIKTENEEEEICILCHLPILTNDYESNLFGIFGAITKDNFIKHAKRISMKPEFEKYNKNKNQDFSSFYNNGSDLSIRIISCNHKVHSECYGKLLINAFVYSTEKKYACPLCKKMGNLFIPCLNYCNKENDPQLNKVLSGFEINELFTDKFNFKEPLDDNIFISPNEFYKKNILNDAIFFIEDFFDGKLIIDINNKSFYYQSFDILIKEFENFLIFYSIVEDKNSQIDIWTNLILSLRILLKTKKLRMDKFLSEFCLSIKFLKKGKDQTRQVPQLFIRNFIEQEIDKILFLTLVLFDLENAENFLINLFSPYIAITAFIKKIFLENDFLFLPSSIKNSITLELFNKFINEDNIENNDYISLKDCFDILLEKIHIFSLINKNKKYKKKTDKNSNSNEEDEDTISTSTSSEKKVNSYKELDLENYENKPFSELILNFEKTLVTENKALSVIFRNKFKNEKILQIIFKDFQNTLERISIQFSLNQNMLLFGKRIKFKFITLPDSMIDFLTHFQKIKCIGCGNEEKLSLVCLLCGEKLCDSKVCIPKENNPNKEPSYLYHSNRCGNGNTAYITTEYGDIFFVYHKQVIGGKIWAYLNQYGEQIQNSYTITNDYVLKHKEYEKAEKMFINFSYRTFQKIN